MTQILEKKETAITHHNDTSPLLTAIQQVIVQPDIDIDKIEKMIELQQKIEDKEAEKSFNSAFAKMQTEMPEVAEKTQGHGYNYASFEHIQKVVKPILSKNGFSLSFDIANSNDSATVTGWLRHTSGHKVSSTYTAPLDTSGSKKGNLIQASGSTISYLERYLTIAMLNITTHGVDDDAFSASSYEPKMNDDFFIQQLRHVENKKDALALYKAARANKASSETLNAISKKGNEL